MAGKKRRGITFGTVFMLIMTAAVLGSSAFVLLRLSSGHSVDLSQLQAQVVQLQTENPAETEANASGNTAAEQTPAITLRRDNNTPAPAESGEKESVLTFGGIIAVEDQVRKSGYASDTKKYDFTDIFALLKPELRGSLSGAFLENLITDDAKVSNYVIPAAGAEIMSSAGFSAAFAGFGKAWEKGEAGISATIRNLKEKNVTPLGISTEAAKPRFVLATVNGMHFALMQYTTLVPANTRKTMQRNGTDFMIAEADPETIASDIAAAREAGAQAVAVLLNWGKAGGKNPEKSQLVLAQQIADSGADLIIGAGSRTPQRVEYLDAADGRKVLCAYSLGTLISDNRKSANRMGGFLIHIHFKSDENQKPVLSRVTYTPTYVWKYRQDSKDYFRVLASNKPSPDGMDTDQIRQMQKTLAAVQEVLEGSPAEIRQR